MSVLRFLDAFCMVKKFRIMNILHGASKVLTVGQTDRVEQTSNPNEMPVTNANKAIGKSSFERPEFQ
ncbi:hypothetical protein D9M69_665890 [compost metagenome]